MLIIIVFFSFFIFIVLISINGINTSIGIPAIAIIGGDIIK